MPVYQLEEEMSYDEFSNWMKYFEKRPVGWRDDLRFAYIMRALGDKRDVQQIFPSLKAVMGSSEEREASQTLKGSYLFHKMLSAVGGDKLDILSDL